MLPSRSGILAPKQWTRRFSQRITLIPHIPTLIPRIPRIPNIPTPIPCIPTLIPRIPALIPLVPIIPLISFPDSLFQHLQIAQITY